MGYYITAEGTIEMPRSLEDEALHALKMLNYQHEQKRAGTYPKTGDPFVDYRYSWMPERWHDTVKSVTEVLELVGFTVEKERRAGLDVYTVIYDSKSGQEEVFLNCLADYAQVMLDVVGEDGERWRWVNAKAGAPLEFHEAVITYRKITTVKEMLVRQHDWDKKMEGLYA